MSSSNFCPNVLPLLVIGDNPSLVAQVSSALARKRGYVALVDEPRIHRPDVKNEYVRRHNVAARIKAKHIIYADVADEIVEGIDLPLERIIRVSDLSDLLKHSDKIPLRAEEYMVWGLRNLAIGLLKALRAGKILRIVPDGPNATEVETESGQFVFCEDHNELTTLQAANYAYSIGAGLRIIPSTSDREDEQILERLYSINARIEGEILSATQRLEAIANEMRQFVGNVPAGVEALTFITSAVPWGFGYPELPSTHLFTYPDLGIHLANAIAAEQLETPGIRLAAVIEPGQVNAAEVDVVIESLCFQSVLVREYQGDRATVNTVGNAIELFPYDLLFISSHCGDTPGWQRTYNFKDSEGKDRELVVNIAASFGVEPGEELVTVRTYESFISLDGVDWHDPEREQKLDVGTAITDWQELTKKPDGLEPTKQIEIPRVRGSAAIKVWDHVLLIAPSQLASHNTPLVINNACASWHRLAKTFTFMNARAYIGTLFEVGDTEAFEIIKLLFTKYYDRPLSVALWHAQNAVYGKTARRPYILSGPHFQRIRTVRGGKVNFLGRLLTRLHKQYVESFEKGAIPEKFLKQWKQQIDFFEYELNALRYNRTDPSNRPSSARAQADDLV